MWFIGRFDIEVWVFFLGWKFVSGWFGFSDVIIMKFFDGMYEVNCWFDFCFFRKFGCNVVVLVICVF